MPKGIGYGSQHTKGGVRTGGLANAGKTVVPGRKTGKGGGSKGGGRRGY